MQEFFSIAGLTTLAMLVLLQAVLGFDNLLYISIESKRAPEDQQSWVRRVGIVLAIVLRIVLLLLIMVLIERVGAPLFSIEVPNPWAEAAAEAPLESTAEAPAAQDTHSEEKHSGDHAARPGGAEYLFYGDFTLHSLITLFGGAFILYTAVKEVLHLLAVEHIEHGDGQGAKPVWAVVSMIVVMNLVFSFDSILSAMALTNHFSRGPAFWLMACAVVISGLMMIYLADTVSEFLKKNRMYEVLGLFILFIVGVMLLGEGATSRTSRCSATTSSRWPRAPSTLPSRCWWRLTWCRASTARSCSPSARRSWVRAVTRARPAAGQRVGGVSDPDQTATKKASPGTSPGSLAS